MNEDLSELLAQQFSQFQPGKIITGRVVDLHKDYVLVDIGYKSEGLVFRSEFKDFEQLEPGQEIKVMLETMEPDDSGLITLSKEKADVILNWDRIEEAYREEVHIKGKIVAVIKGGFRADIGIPAFLPLSQADLKPIVEPRSLVGQTCEFKVIKLDRSRNNAVVSRREILEEIETERKTEALKTLEVNQVVKGAVRNIVDYGVFVDLGDITGLLHINDLSWSRINHPSQLVAIGEELEVQILKIDNEKKEISLGLKQLGPNPWDGVEQKYPSGTRVSGKVVNITPYGAFIKLEEGVEGLLHISEISWTSKVKHPSEVLAMGDDVEVEVIGVDPDNQKISFSLKALEPNPWETIAQKYPPGTIVKGKVYNITNYGAFVELEKGIDGLLHISNLSAEKVKHPSELLKKGDKLEVMVLKVDVEKRRVALGRKQLLEGEGVPLSGSDADEKGQADVAPEEAVVPPKKKRVKKEAVSAPEETVGEEGVSPPEDLRKKKASGKKAAAPETEEEQESAPADK